MAHRCGAHRLRWATAVWEGYPNPRILQKCLEGAWRRLAGAKTKWGVATDPVVVFLLTLQRLDWQARDFRTLVTDMGRTVDLLRLAPKAVQSLAIAAAGRSSDRRALGKLGGAQAGKLASPLFWDCLLPLTDGECKADWGRREQASYRALLSNTHWPQARQAAHDPSRTDQCQLCQGEAGTLWHRRYACPASEQRRRQATSSPLR